MTGKLVLTRQIDASGWLVIGFVAKACKRRELEPVLLRARETGGTTAGDVAKHLFFAESRTVVANRLLRIADMLGLLEEHERGVFVLTPNGETAIEKGEVFVPEHGAWAVWVSEDPLLASPVLRIDPWDKDEDAFAESQKGRKDKRCFEKLPNLLVEIEDKEVVPPAAGDGIAVRIDELEKLAEEVDADASLHLEWNVQENRLGLRGKWGDEKVDSRLEPPQAPSDEVWEALLESEGLSEDWDRQRRALRVDFWTTNETERENMFRELEFEKPSVSEYGQFDTLKVPGVAITAASRDDALEWSNWRLRQRVRDFAASERYAEWLEEASEPFAEYSLDPPARAALAKLEWDPTNGRPTSRAWYLIAAEDWGL